MIIGLIVLVLCILLLLSGFFSGLETAYVSLNHIQIKRLEEKDKRAVLVEELKENSHKLITTILICNNLVNISASAIATYLTINLFGVPAIGISTGILTFIILVFGEVSPKKLAIDYNASICLHSASILKFIMLILTPFIWIIDKSSAVIINTLGKKEKKPKMTEEDIISAVEIGEEIGELEPQEREMIHNIFKFNDIEVDNIMTHRIDVFRLEENTKIKDVIELIFKKGFSRIPIYHQSENNITGILLLKKIMPYLEDKVTNAKIKDIMVKPLFVPETRKIDDMLKDFNKKKTHIAIVIDEMGGFSGIITAEDVLEEIVGEIYDEKDVAYKKIKRLNKNTYMIRGDLEIEDINDVLKLKLSQKEKYEVISRYIMRKTGKVPKEGQEVKIKKGKFIIEDVKNNRIELVKYVKK